MKNIRNGMICSLVVMFFMSLSGCSNQMIETVQLLSTNTKQYDKTIFVIKVNQTYANPFDQEEVMLDLLMTTPSGKPLVLPCYFEKQERESSFWKARFAPAEEGKYIYQVALTSAVENEKHDLKNFTVSASESEGFLHVNDKWTLKFDSGKPFRGIGENVCWEARSHENPKHTYDYLLPTLSNNGANFFRTWMCSWDLPVFWNKVNDTDRYQNSEEYFHPQGIKRMDELINMCDSLDLYLMLAMDYHGALISGGGWEDNNYNQANGGPAASPADFFVNETARKMSKNKFRYLIARWGYSTHLAMWEFFNEIDNAVFTGSDSILISHADVTEWHKEMSEYIKKTDPYHHIVTTSVSHREIEGLFQLENIDIAQRHIYKHTDQIPALINRFSTEYKKPFVWGEFGYEWDWNLDFSAIVKESNYDYKRGLWYGLFNPTPVLPMTWWWEFFDEQKMTPYFQNVSIINHMMLDEGNGQFETVEVKSENLESMAVKCGMKYFIAVLNNTETLMQSDIVLEIKTGAYHVEQFDPNGQLVAIGKQDAIPDGLRLSSVSMDALSERIYILTPVK